MRLRTDTIPDPVVRAKVEQLVSPIASLLGIEDTKDLLSLTVRKTVLTAYVQGRTARGKLIPGAVVRLSVKVVDE
jgi:hypothetical protein